MRRATVGTALALALLGWACDPGGGSARPQVGMEAPAYRAATLAGDTVSLEELRGRPVLLNLWATWCLPCRQETPYLRSLHERFREDGLEVVGVSVDSRAARADVLDFVEEYGVEYTILHDPEGRALDTFAALGLPATFVLDREGTVRFSRTGPVLEGEAAFESVLERVIADDEAGAESEAPG